ncbi:MAG: PmoA family protein [Armatimonadetes bacterium]|nr:PmoA family protein [Armatimonadota bacterium]
MEDESVLLRVEVRATEASYQGCPVWMPLSRRLPEIPLALMEGATPVAAQVVEREGKRWLVWIEPNLPKGGRKLYTLRPHPQRPRGFEHTRTEQSVQITYQGKPFTAYVLQGAPKPYLYPLYGANGKPITRHFPMRVVQGESMDHPHHRSVWFTHGAVNGVDFWGEGAGKGKIVPRELVRVESGLVLSRIVARNDWVAPDGKTLLEETTEIIAYAAPEARWLDYTVSLKAKEEPVRFGDTKEGTFGVRVASSMEVTRGEGGQIVNARGQRNKDAWGKRAEWCDYTGPVEGEIVGIAIFDHPANFRHPTYWHVRDYGLFAVNPFGIHDFEPDKPAGTGDYLLASGQTLTLRYRLYLHKGRTDEARVAEQFEAYRHAPQFVSR